MTIAALVLVALDWGRRVVCGALGHDEGYWVTRRCRRCGESFWKEAT